MDQTNPNLSRLSQIAGTQSAQQGTGYTNLNRLTQANQGNQLGEKVAGNIQSQIGNVQNQLGQQQQQFQTQSEANKLGSDTDIKNRNDIINKFAPSSTQTQQPDQSTDNTSPKSNTADMSSGRSGANLTPASGSTAIPAQVTPTDKDISSFQRFVGGQYTGPTGLADTSGLSTSAQQLQGQVSNISPSGTQELLRRTVGGDRYTQGQQQLDSLLMNRSALTPVARQAVSLGGNINRANLAASGQAELLKNQAAQFGTDTQAQLNAGLTGIDTAVQGQLTAAQAVEKDRQQKIQAIQNFANNKVARTGDLTAEDIAAGNKKDASGNIIDQYGNTVTDTSVNARGGSDQYGQIDYLQKLLASQGAQSGELNQLFGQGNAVGGAATLSTTQQGINDTMRNDFEKQGAPRAFSDAFGNGQISPDSVIAQKYLRSTAEGQYIDQDAMNRDIQNGQLSIADLKNQMGDIGQQGLARTTQNEINNPNRNATYNPQRTAATNAFYGTQGIIGQALQGGKTENLYKSLANTLSNSEQAQNLNAQGVASDTQRQNYLALNQLLGNQASSSKYQNSAYDANGNPITDTSKYKAGNFLLNPDDLKRTL